ncbi:type VI secretion lipoprotein, VC_A0113 family [Desulfocapsa sulfexigens DSM 10523]|uniref:Type VI secretion lipoprotein, VC_A0113 family n=1 Tax=Desulfocapsa sulfexigens (strain DSM 10523 / SB164P1) TaxID=1167006 RepID=M1PSA8_DESSD|nr:type VI secretion system lipoprotein TssJ [Desulfocapsa sulfexigens]AGF79246.1 type VI secretion lipoprotein, VC_A0113 family [Desulfocapsa sulfexigens DSM 10523]
MKRYFTLIILLSSLVLLSSCGSKAPAPPPVPQWVYEKDSITMRIKADHLLNLNEGTPHTLMVGIYQLRNKAMFEQLASNSDGIYQLLDCEPFDSSVTSVKRLFIQPEQDLTIVMDRLAGTKHIGLVAGYFVLQKERMVRTINIPVIIDKSYKYAEAGKLNLIVNLGSEQIAAIQTH